MALPRLYGDPGLELCPAAVAEPGAHPEEGLLVAGRLPRAAQSKEGVMLHGALPQVLAALLRGQPGASRGLLLRCPQYFHMQLHCSVHDALSTI